MSSYLKSKLTLVCKTLSFLDIVMKKTTSKQVYYGLMGWFELQKKEIPLQRANKVVFFGIEAHKPRSNMKCPGPCCLYYCWCTSGISVTCSNKLSMVKNLHLETKINLIGSWTPCSGPGPWWWHCSWCWCTSGTYEICSNQLSMVKNI